MSRSKQSFEGEAATFRQKNYYTTASLHPEHSLLKSSSGIAGYVTDSRPESMADLSEMGGGF